MNKTAIFLAAAIVAFAWVATAQDTNNLKTVLGVFESRTGAVIIKAVGQVGSVAAGPQEISVRVKETTDVSIGQKTYGLIIQVESGQTLFARIYVDDDEIDPLLNAINYLLKINYDVTALPGFEAGFTTKAGLRVLAHSIRRNGGIQHFLQYADEPRIPLDTMQLSQLYTFIAQGRKQLDELKGGK